LRRGEERQGHLAEMPAPRSSGAIGRAWRRVATPGFAPERGEVASARRPYQRLSCGACVFTRQPKQWHLAGEAAPGGSAPLGMAFFDQFSTSAYRQIFSRDLLHDFLARLRDFPPHLHDFLTHLHDFAGVLHDFVPGLRDFPGWLRDFLASLRDFWGVLHDLAAGLPDFAGGLRGCRPCLRDLESRLRGFPGGLRGWQGWLRDVWPARGRVGRATGRGGGRVFFLAGRHVGVQPLGCSGRETC